MDSKFSTAIHMLILISRADTPMSSKEIANSVGCNSSFVRKIALLLKYNGIIDSNQGKSGYKLCIDEKKLSLYEIYKSLYENEMPTIFEIHNNSNDKCIVGKYIKPTLENMYVNIEKDLVKMLKNKKLYDCIVIMEKLSGRK